MNEGFKSRPVKKEKEVLEKTKKQGREQVPENKNNGDLTINIEETVQEVKNEVEGASTMDNENPIFENLTVREQVSSDIDLTEGFEETIKQRQEESANSLNISDENVSDNKTEENISDALEIASEESNHKDGEIVNNAIKDLDEIIKIIENGNEDISSVESQVEEIRENFAKSNIPEVLVTNKLNEVTQEINRKKTINSFQERINNYLQNGYKEDVIGVKGLFKEIVEYGSLGDESVKKELQSMANEMVKEFDDIKLKRKMDSDETPTYDNVSEAVLIPVQYDAPGENLTDTDDFPPTQPPITGNNKTSVESNTIGGKELADKISTINRYINAKVAGNTIGPDGVEEIKRIYESLKGKIGEELDDNESLIDLRKIIEKGLSDELGLDSNIDNLDTDSAASGGSEGIDENNSDEGVGLESESSNSESSGVSGEEENENERQDSESGDGDNSNNEKNSDSNEDVTEKSEKRKELEERKILIEEEIKKLEERKRGGEELGLLEKELNSEKKKINLELERMDAEEERERLYGKYRHNLFSLGGVKDLGTLVAEKGSELKKQWKESKSIGDKISHASYSMGTRLKNYGNAMLRNPIKTGLAGVGIYYAAKPVWWAISNVGSFLKWGGVGYLYWRLIVKPAFKEHGVLDTYNSFKKDWWGDKKSEKKKDEKKKK